MRKRQIIKFAKTYCKNSIENPLIIGEYVNDNWNKKNAKYAIKCYNRLKHLLYDKNWNRERFVKG